MIVDELMDFRDKLMKYIVYRKRPIMEHKKLTRKEYEDFESIYNEISISAGKYALLIKECTGLETIPTSAGPQDVWNWAFSFGKNTLVMSALDTCLQATNRAIGKLADDIAKGVRDKQGNVIEKPSSIATEPPNAFIAHGGETEALRKLREFLVVLGITPLTAEEEPSEGRSVDEQVKWCLDNSDCAIILGTSDDKNLKDGKLYPRPNVCIEIGRVQERFPDKVIYLLEEGASFPSNITEKVYERFAQDNMEKAFLKIAKELKRFGIIRATAIRRRSAQNL